jgi:hypothetical protein
MLRQSARTNREVNIKEEEQWAKIIVSFTDTSVIGPATIAKPLITERYAQICKQCGVITTKPGHQTTENVLNGQMSHSVPFIKKSLLLEETQSGKHGSSSKTRGEVL